MTAFLLEHGSYVLLTLVLVSTGFGLPVPEEIPVIVAGVLASHGQLNPWLALASCLLGVLGGDCVIYAIGRRFGRNLVRTRRYWARVVKPDREAQIEQMIERHGLKVLFLARLLVVLRSPVYLMVGILRMPFRRFFLIDVCCATIVVGTIFLLSFTFGQTVTRWIWDLEVLITVLVVLAVAGVLVFSWRLWRRRRGRAASTAGESTASQRPACDDHGAQPERSQDDTERPG